VVAGAAPHVERQDPHRGPATRVRGERHQQPPSNSPAAAQAGAAGWIVC
jgi:hypothetical protein